MRLAFGMSKAGFLGLMKRKMMRMRMPERMRRRLKKKQRIAPHQTRGLVFR